MLIGFYFFYAIRNAHTISNDLAENIQVFSMALTERSVRDGALTGLADTESQPARCLLLFDDRTFFGDVRSSEMGHNRKCGHPALFYGFVGIC